jgi:hypothetical protein
MIQSSKPEQNVGSPTHLISAAASGERAKMTVLALVGLLYSSGIAYLFLRLPNRLLTDDLYSRWYASKMLLTRGRSLYDWTNAYELVHIIGWPHAFDLRFYYPATLLFFTGPLSLLPYDVAVFIWRVFGLWCLWFSIVIFARLPQAGLSINRLTWLLVMMTTAVPVLQHTIYAQFNSLTAAALALTYYTLLRRKYLLAGLLAGGMLFKPQVAVLPLLIILIWTALERERWRFWVGWIMACVVLWGVPELFEPNWLLTFSRALASYPPVLSVVDRIWNPYQGVSLALVLFTLWLTFRLRRYPASSINFTGLLAWGVAVTALIVPIYGMLNIVLMGLVLAILLNGFTQLYPQYTGWLWWGIVALFIAGMLAFVLPLLLAGFSGAQISSAELVYRFTLPVLLSLTALPLIFYSKAEPV